MTLLSVQVFVIALTGKTSFSVFSCCKSKENDAPLVFCMSPAPGLTSRGARQ